jgi:hypothetical protein
MSPRQPFLEMAMKKPDVKLGNVTFKDYGKADKWEGFDCSFTDKLPASDCIHMEFVPLQEREVWNVVEGNSRPEVRRYQMNDFQQAFVSQLVKYGEIRMEYYTDRAKNIFYWRKHEDYA